MQSDFIFKLTDDYRKHEECIQILHGFSYRVIRERKEKIASEQKKLQLDDNNNNNQSRSHIDENGNVVESNHVDDEESFGKKKRLAFLDLLINASGNGLVLTDEDIREEVDTFVRFFYSFQFTV